MSLANPANHAAHPKGAAAGEQAARTLTGAGVCITGTPFLQSSAACRHKITSNQDLTSLPKIFCENTAHDYAGNSAAFCEQVRRLLRATKRCLQSVTRAQNPLQINALRNLQFAKPRLNKVNQGYPSSTKL
ncbi:hypothetical protein KEC55_22740 [Burkholderia cepacia]|uniref:hypothetical protein n=1 Tax=Burkholderia cepacia TaxID=292 RepID=UPI00249F856A|nr:hypothetical protein [Burkholderia cepacia]WGY72603.1 hypothetical protein KEC55_22740 [Burkholderia cepacia]